MGDAEEFERVNAVVVGGYTDDVLGHRTVELDLGLVVSAHGFGERKASKTVGCRVVVLDSTAVSVVFAVDCLQRDDFRASVEHQGHVHAFTTKVERARIDSVVENLHGYLWIYAESAFAILSRDLTCFLTSHLS